MKHTPRGSNGPLGSSIGQPRMHEFEVLAYACGTIKRVNPGSDEYRLQLMGLPDAELVSGLGRNFS